MLVAPRMTMTVIKTTFMDKSVSWCSVCYLLVQQFCHSCHLSLVTLHSGGGGGRAHVAIWVFSVMVCLGGESCAIPKQVHIVRALCTRHPMN